MTTLVLFASVVVTQENSQTRHWGVPENSETNAVIIEEIRTLIKAEPNPDGVIILIARLGRGETKRELNRRRLYNVSFRYKALLKIPAEKIVTAEGERVDDYGRVEIYWNGKIIGALPVFKNKDIRVDCCDIDERYYPWKNAVERRQKQRIKKRKRG